MTPATWIALAKKGPSIEPRNFKMMSSRSKTWKKYGRYTGRRNNVYDAGEGYLSIGVGKWTGRLPFVVIQRLH